MCVIFFTFALTQGAKSQSAHHPYRLIAAANRDEFLARPTKEADFWQHPHAHVLAGTDLVHSHACPSTFPLEQQSKVPPDNVNNNTNNTTNMIRGTWFGVTKTGRFAFITNVREAKIIPNGLSRGFLVSDFLISSDSPFVYLQKLSRLSDKYTGFNLVVGDLLMDPRGGGGVWYYGNKSHEGVIQLQPGLVYGISNGNALVTGGEWWKVKTGVISVENAINNWKLCDVTSRNRCSNNIEAVQDLQEMLEDSNREEEQQQTQQFNTGAASTGRMNELVESLLDILRDKSSPDTPPSTPQTPLERFLAPICIDQHNGYGTRTHTVLCIDEFWNAKMTEVDRYTLQDGVVWTGRESRIVSESIVETGIDFSEQRRDFAFRIEAAPGDVEDDVVKQQRNVIVSETDDDDNEI